MGTPLCPSPHGAQLETGRDQWPWERRLPPPPGWSPPSQTAPKIPQCFTPPGTAQPRGTNQHTEHHSPTLQTPRWMKTEQKPLNTNSPLQGRDQEHSIPDTEQRTQTRTQSKKAKPLEIKNDWHLPGGPEVKTPCFRCRGCGFNPWSGN